MSDQAAINWDEVVGYVQQTGNKDIWGKLSQDERAQYLEALKRWQSKSPGIAGRPDSAMIGAGGHAMLNPEDVFLGGALLKGVHGLVKGGKNIIRGGPANLGRVSPEGGGIVDKAGLPAQIKVKSKGHPSAATPDPPNLQRMGNSGFTETEKRANMFGGVGEGTAVKPGAKGPATFKGIEKSDELSEAEKLIQEIMKGKTGGSLPNNARRGAVLKSPKKK